MRLKFELTAEKQVITLSPEKPAETKILEIIFADKAFKARVDERGDLVFESTDKDSQYI